MPGFRQPPYGHATIPADALFRMIAIRGLHFTAQYAEAAYLEFITPLTTLMPEYSGR